MQLYKNRVFAHQLLLSMIAFTSITAKENYRAAQCEHHDADARNFSRTSPLTQLGAGCNSPWMYCDDGECKCGETPHDIVQCSIGRNTTILSCYCMTHSEISGLTDVGGCIYGCGVDSSDRFPLPKKRLNEFMCGRFFNRDGMLCGKCKDGHYPLAYSFDMNCVQCPNGKSNWWKFLLAAFSPLTIFYLVIVFFRFNITSSHLHGFVYYSQTLTLPASNRLILLYLWNQKGTLAGMRFLGTIYGIWNLDFLRMLNLGICLGTDTLQTLALDLVVAVYPLLLMMVSYVLIHLYDRNVRPLVLLWKPFHFVLSLFRKKWDSKTSVIDAFATFFLLSNVKFLSVSFDLLYPVKVYQLNSTGHLTRTWRLYYDATVPYFGPRHLQYAIPATVMLMFFVLLPVLLLILYPFRWFQKFLNLFPVRWYILHTFVDSFQGCYKDGTEPGTRDCRWFACAFFVARIIAIIIGWSITDYYCLPFVIVIWLLLAIAMMQIQPFKKEFHHYTFSNTVFLLLIALWHVSMLGLGTKYMHRDFFTQIFLSTSVFAAVLPLLYGSIMIIRWMYSHRLFGVDLRIRRRDYDVLH